MSATRKYVKEAAVKDSRPIIQARNPDSGSMKHLLGWRPRANNLANCWAHSRGAGVGRLDHERDAGCCRIGNNPTDAACSPLSVVARLTAPLPGIERHSSRLTVKLPNLGGLAWVSNSRLRKYLANANFHRPRVTTTP